MREYIASSQHVASTSFELSKFAYGMSELTSWSIMRFWHCQKDSLAGAHGVDRFMGLASVVGISSTRLRHVVARARAKVMADVVGDIFIFVLFLFGWLISLELVCAAVEFSDGN